MSLIKHFYEAFRSALNMYILENNILLRINTPQNNY